MRFRIPLADTKRHRHAQTVDFIAASPASRRQCRSGFARFWRRTHARARDSLLVASATGTLATVCESRTLSSPPKRCADVALLATVGFSPIVGFWRIGCGSSLVASGSRARVFGRLFPHTDLLPYQGGVPRSEAPLSGAKSPTGPRAADRHPRRARIRSGGASVGVYRRGPVGAVPRSAVIFFARVEGSASRPWIHSAGRRARASRLRPDAPGLGSLRPW